MTHTAVRIAFYLLPSKKKEGSNDCPVYMRISYGTKSINLSTGIWLPENEWVAKKSKVKGNTAKAYCLNKQLQEMEDRIYQIVSSQQLQDGKVNLEQIEYKFRNKDTSKTLIDLFNYHIANLKLKLKVKEMSADTIEQYETCLKKINAFLMEPPYRSADISLEKLDNEFISRFASFLISRYKNSANTVSLYVTKLKAVIHEGVRIGWLNRDPFMLYKNKQEKKYKEPLTFNEIIIIENLELKPGSSECIVRDLFIFGTLTGMSYIDMKAFNKNHITHTLNGTFIIYNRIKTDVPTRVPYFDKAKQIVERYKNHPVCIQRGTLLPVPTNVGFNQYLKSIAKKAGIHKNISVHISRHSFATNALETGASLISISKALGHSDIKITAGIYTKVTDQAMVDSFSNFSAVIDTKPDNEKNVKTK